MNDISIIALAGVIGFVIIALCIIWGTIIYKQENFRLKSDTNIKTDLQDGKVDFDSSIDIEGNKKAKENSGLVSEAQPLSSNNK
ncbi:hypothetical protein [Clostridium sp. JN-9]|uniref:hypothetical protein n=1 Tax=Clostridium sp. JN-9 TaxID=2507159 RepID=UPI000FFE0558|nr:hypothetical protein [Clostridium sp. JN-9]QAT40929.1 hypothetical protein EQM05_12015 [Clostridium sp. JN-9]